MYSKICARSPFAGFVARRIAIVTDFSESRQATGVTPGKWVRRASGGRMRHSGPLGEFGGVLGGGGGVCRSVFVYEKYPCRLPRLDYLLQVSVAERSAVGIIFCWSRSLESTPKYEFGLCSKGSVEIWWCSGAAWTVSIVARSFSGASNCMARKMR